LNLDKSINNLAQRLSRFSETSTNPNYNDGINYWKGKKIIEAAIFIGINKVISRALDSDGVSIYPCKVLNRFACPYDGRITKDIMEDGITQKPDVDYLFYLSEIAFAVELALAKAQEEDSVFRIKSAEDVYHVLTDQGALERVLQQGLKEEHRKYKEKIVEFFMSIKDRIKVEDLRVY
jgi:hypothetical protein